MAQKKKRARVVLESNDNISESAWPKIRSVLLEFSKLLGVEICVSNPHGIECEPKTEEGKLFIRFWSTPTRVRNTTFVELFGIPIPGSGQRDGRESTGTGVPLVDPISRKVFGEIHGGTLYILFDLPHERYSEIEKLMGQILQHFVVAADASEAVPRWLHNRRAATAQRLRVARREEEAKRVFIRESNHDHWDGFLQKLRPGLLKRPPLAVPIEILPPRVKDKTLDEDKLCISLAYDDERVIRPITGEVSGREGRISYQYSPKGMWIELWDLTADSEERREFEMITKILSKTIPLAFEPDPAKRQERKEARKKAEREAMKKVWIEKIRGRLQWQKKEAEEAVAKTENAVRDLQRQLVEKIRSADELRVRARYLKEEMEREGATEMYEREFTQLFELPHVVDVKFSDRTIEVFTDNLYCDEGGKRYDFGKYRMVIQTDGKEGGVQFFNLTRKVRGFDGRMCHHPHVFSEGNACFGNIQEAIPELIAKSEYVVLVTLCLQFLQSVSVEDQAGRWVTNWPVVTPEKGETA